MNHQKGNKGKMTNAFGLRMHMCIIPCYIHIKLSAFYNFSLLVIVGFHLRLMLLGLGSALALSCYEDLWHAFVQCICIYGLSVAHECELFSFTIPLTLAEVSSENSDDCDLQTMACGISEIQCKSTSVFCFIASMQEPRSPRSRVKVASRCSTLSF